MGRGDPAAAADAGPAAPHITEELWSRRAGRGRARRGRRSTRESWPEVDAAAVVEATREVPVQVNGKLRDRVIVPADADAGGHRGRGPGAHPKIAALLAGRTPGPGHPAGGGKLVNIVLKGG